MLGFAEHQSERGLSAATIHNRTLALSAFHRWLGREPWDVEHLEIERFLRGRKLGSRSRYWWLSTLSNFYCWAIDVELTTTNPVRRIPRPRMKRLVPRPMAEADVLQAVAMATPVLKCWLLLAAYAGLRCIEIAGIEREDVLDTAVPAMLVVVHGKGDKERVVPLHPSVLEALRALPMPRSGPLWTNRYGNAISPSALSKRLNRFLHGLSITSTAHQGRHYFATEVYRLSHDLRLTQELMGHASPATTAIYAAWDQSGASEVVAQVGASPALACHRDR